MFGVIAVMPLCFGFFRLPEGFAVEPVGLAVGRARQQESGWFRVPEGFAVEPVGLAVGPLGQQESECFRVPEVFAVLYLCCAVLFLSG